jgi:hypothetical protein
MSSARFMSAFLVFMISVVAMYIFSITFGAAMDQMGYIFPGIQANLTLPANWDAVATKTLTYWGLLWRSITVIIIAMGIWVVRVAVIDVDYTRPQQ